MKEVIRYEHTCLRCKETWVSEDQNPLRCGKCKTPYWNYQREFVHLRNRAGQSVSMAMRKKKLPRLSKENISCVDCGKRAVHYDHRDYRKPLEVEPVCQSCNVKRGPAKWNDLNIVSSWNKGKK